LRIKSIFAREIFDSRAFPTVEAEVTLECGVTAAASVPSGASTGSHEAHELRDGGERLKGKGVTRAVANVNGEIAKALTGRRADEQRYIDDILEELDGTPDFSRLGANACLAVSMACAQAAAKAYNMELHRYLGGMCARKTPLPMMNIINGGAHADNSIDIQEFMIVPIGADSFPRAMRMCCEVYHALKGILKSRGYSAAVGDEGGFAPELASDADALFLMNEAVLAAELTPGKDIAFALDAAASEWFDDGKYHMPKRNIDVSRDELIDFYIGMCEKYPIISIEDPFAEDDFDSFITMRGRISSLNIVGDDLFVTNAERVKRHADCASSVLIKPNQAGTVSRALDAISAARANGMNVIASHRSGETESTFISDFAVAVSAEFIKSGAPARMERVAKYNRLLKISENLLKSV